jgi:hypothetical protein
LIERRGKWLRTNGRSDYQADSCGLSAAGFSDLPKTPTETVTAHLCPLNNKAAIGDNTNNQA